MKRVVLVHGWAGHPDNGWFAWMMLELGKRGFAVIAPQLPDTDTPEIGKWVPALARAVGTADADTYFIGHSMGCETIARYVETLPEGMTVGGVVYVAGFFKRLTLDEEEDEAVWEAWRTAPIDLHTVKAHAPKSIAIFSDDDPYVPMENIDDFRDVLGSEIIIEHGKQHFSGDEGYKELPEALDALLTLAGEAS